ncbi:unnamed protein product [Xylocopa violacea]|uniref:Uncharacterized protein n=1 Tax=Xylocopa violacea TaxID=135666 RepID=A0ABP1NCR8_XYLVO
MQRISDTLLPWHGMCSSAELLITLNAMLVTESRLRSVSPPETYQNSLVNPTPSSSATNYSSNSQLQQLTTPVTHDFSNPQLQQPSTPTIHNSSNLQLQQPTTSVTHNSSNLQLQQSTTPATSNSSNPRLQ